MEEKNLPILVVEDDEDVLSLYIKLLGEDYNLLSATNGKDAFDIFENNPDIAVVLTDVIMESDIAGIELINRIVKIKPATQFIIVSAIHEDSFIALQTLKGIASLPKPVDSLHLKLAVKSAYIRYNETVWLENFKAHLASAPWLKNC